MEQEEIAKIREYVKKQRDDHRKLNEWLNSVFEPNVKTIVGWINEFRPDFRDCEKEMENLILRLKSLNSFYEKIESIDSQIGTQCDWSKNYLNLLHRTTTRYSFAFLTEYFCNEKSISVAMNNDGWRRDVVNLTLQLRDRSLEINIKEIDSAFAHLENFALFKHLNNNFVIIGANGSGKSSFSRRTREVLGGNVVIIASQKIFLFNPIESLPFGNKWRQELVNYQGRDKLHRADDRNDHIVDGLTVVTNALFEEENELAHEYYHDKSTERKESTLERAIALWGKILNHRSLKTKNGNILVQMRDGQEYPFMQLSDGEKAVFYYVAYILLAKENSYVIVDEPENHLHLALVTKLWDALERARPDCQFIYLTHNLEFAASRNNVEKIWMKRFVAPDKWEMEKLPTDDVLPEILYMELLGSRKPILFCEGKKDSLDYKLYTRLFPNYTVIPVEGHLHVISYTRAFNNSYNVHHNKAIGIIDGDFHKQEQKDVWKKDSIYSLDVQEIENILCDENVLKCAINYFHADQSVLEKAKEKLFIELQKHIDNQCTEYTVQMINNRFKENMLKNSKDLTTLKNSVKELADKMLENVDAFVDERKECLQRIIEVNDFAEGVKRYNNKGLMSILTTDIEKDYKNRVFKMLDENPDLLETLRSKYFADVPRG